MGTWVYQDGCEGVPRWVRGHTKMGVGAHQDGCGGTPRWVWGQTKMDVRAMGGDFKVGEVWEVDWDVARVVGDFGGRDSRSKRFSELNDIDITLLNIDWVGSLGDPNDKKINHPEVT